eukprot:CAMPEP_0194171920 /NCGR_PEP_ID=MMETSP0154-20130528/6486_1 /TAXON_ID=1049557 /ORGANISM="Thalassiothrix antarctica, Strain L6-D1" /LENGTH=94 /DNA_ID=CAMNT_0038884441 /DNA_START=56 /DNA_END=337 /DNA_ORIENTATION=+
MKCSSFNPLIFKKNHRMIIHGLSKKSNRRLYSSSQVTRKTFDSDSIRSKTKCYLTIADTPLGKHAAGSALLDGLDVFTVNASGDDHPLSVFGIN